MRKQTKLVAVLSTAALLAIGASMTSFAATGWAEEDGTWVYYDRNGDRVTDKWAKSGNNWYYLDGAGEMAIDQLIEDDDNYYYVDVNGVMVTNQWVAIENEDAGNDNEPDEWWYYFQANGKALKGPEDNKVSLKTVNGKKYAFTSEGKMLYGWVDADDAAIINDDDDAALKGPEDNKVSLKTVNGKKYAFTSEGKMLYGWVDADDAAIINDDDDAWQRGDYYFGDQNETVNGKKYAFTSEGKMLYGWVDADDAAIINDDDDAWQRGDYYFGDQNDGAMTVGWRLIDITDENATADTDGNNWIQTAYNDDEDQSRWFWFKSNGKKQTASSGELELKAKTINGKKYGFDEYGRMVAEWAVDFDEAKDNYADAKVQAKDENDNLLWELDENGQPVLDDKGNKIPLYVTPSTGSMTVNEGNPDWSSAWMYFNSVEDGARVAKNWFKVVPAEGLNSSKYNDDEDGWYYADGNGHLYAGEFKTIKGKKYGFDKKGKMLSGMKFIDVNGNEINDIKSDDDTELPFETEDLFDENSIKLAAKGYNCYYFGDGSDGAMKTGKMQVEIDGDKYSFNFGKSGSKKGAGKIGEDDKKFYNSGKLMAAGKDEKYQVIYPVTHVNNNNETVLDGYMKYADSFTFASGVKKISGVEVLDSYADIKAANLNAAQLNQCGLNATKLKDDKYGDLNVFLTETADGAISYNGKKYSLGLDSKEFMVVNTTGTVSKSSAKNKDGNDVYYKLNGGKIVATFSEN